MRRRPVRWPLALAVAAVACSNMNLIEGALSAADGETRVPCLVSSRPAAFENAYWDPCGPAEAPLGTFLAGTEVALGDRFRCPVSANVDRVYAVRAECPGYQPLVVDVFVSNCAALFGSCDAAQAGTLVVQR